MSLGPFESVRELTYDAPFPRLIPVRRAIDPVTEDDPAGAAKRQLEPLRGQITPGMSVAITAGSRGIHDIAVVVKAAGEWLRDAGAEPFVVPAMGSHGGATAEGQREVLAHLGITEESMGMPIRATMDTVELDRCPDGPVVHLDANAAQADGILVVNRIKAHTDFHGEVESGLAKICAIGLGKHRGAAGIHRYGSRGLARWVPEVAHRIIASGKVLGGLAIIENALERTARIALLPANEIGRAGETALLRESQRLMGALPFDQLDLLVVDELGKDKSGSGLDTNVIGRMMIRGTEEFDRPNITNISVHDISAASDGNAVGIGLADFIPFRVLEKIDLHAMYVNAVTSGIGGVQRAQLPLAFRTDRDTVAAALLMCGRADLENARVVRMHDTLDTVSLLVSESLRAEVEAADDLTIVGESGPMTFDADGALLAWS
ncbi:MAG TPA: hypothetical protein VHX59_10885 [Mycobacteriales bacterium]|jgi:hypothetical protein|nr:hypothetical protein [Mycobacteriales bacterium]